MITSIVIVINRHFESVRANVSHSFRQRFLATRRVRVQPKSRVFIKTTPAGTHCINKFIGEKLINLQKSFERFMTHYLFLL